MTHQIGRRALLAATGTALLAGCTGRLGGSDPIENVTFEETRDERQRLHRPIVVEWDEPTVDVTGRIWYGSSTCNYPALEDVSYDAGADRLDVSVVSGRDSLATVCTSDLAGTLYRVSVEFDGELPTTVAARTDHYSEESDERVVDRADQRRRCERGEFDSEEERDHSHWNCPEPWATDE